MKYLIEGEHEGKRFGWSLSLVTTAEQQTICCPSCSGKGYTGWSLGAIDDPTQCTSCHGTGRTTFKFKTPPSPPKELIDALNKTWREYWNKQQNDSFKLTGD